MLDGNARIKLLTDYCLTRELDYGRFLKISMEVDRIKSLRKLINGNSVSREGRKDPQPDLNCYWLQLGHCCYEVRACVGFCATCVRLDNPHFFFSILI